MRQDPDFQREHITLYEFCTHDQPSPELVQELETALDALLRMQVAIGRSSRRATAA